MSTGTAIVIVGVAVIGYLILSNSKAAANPISPNSVDANKYSNTQSRGIISLPNLNRTGGGGVLNLNSMRPPIASNLSVNNPPLITPPIKGVPALNTVNAQKYSSAQTRSVVTVPPIGSTGGGGVVNLNTGFSAKPTASAPAPVTNTKSTSGSRLKVSL